MQETDSLLRACKYSFEPNSLGYCGPEGAYKEFSGFISNPSAGSEGRIKGLFRQFPALHAYLSLIAEKNGLEPFDGKVIEAYWLGNRLLDNINENNIRDLIANEFSKPGLLPGDIAREKAENLPKGIKMNHSFHVLYINFITRKVAPIVKNLGSCLISWGKIEKVQKNNFKVKAQKLVYENNEFKLLEKQRKISAGFAGSAGKGDVVSVHWNKAVEILDEGELKNLIYYTGKNINSLNSMR